MQSIQTSEKSLTATLVGNLLSAVGAALIAWGFIHSQHPVFEVPKQYHITEMGAPDEKVEALRVQQARADRLNAMLDIAVLGGLLAGAMALGRYACCSIPLRAIVAIPWGLLVGAAAGFIGSLAYENLTPASIQPTVLDTVKVQILLFAPLGAAIGLMMGAFARSLRSMIGGTVAGGVAGAVAGTSYPVIAAMIMPSASTDFLIPTESVVRLLWLGLFSLFFALIVPFGAQPQTLKNSSPAAKTEPESSNAGALDDQ